MEFVVASDMSEPVVTWVKGLLVAVGIVGTFLGFWLQVKKVRADAEKSKQSAIDKAVLEAKKETASEQAFKKLQDAVEKMTETVGCLSQSLGKDIDEIRKGNLEQVKWISAIEASTKSAHKRIDEHRAVEHGYPNGLHHRADDTHQEERAV